MSKHWHVGILLFNEIELLDFAGPYEVFSLAEYQDSKDKPFSVHTVAQTKDIILTHNGLRVQADCDFQYENKYDILIVPGGLGAEVTELRNPVLLNWIRDKSKEAELIASVCTGAFLLAEAGVLDGKQATTHWLDIDRFEQRYQRVLVQKNVKFVDETTVMTSAGISAGIQMSLHIVHKFVGKDVAVATAKRMEYEINISDV